MPELPEVETVRLGLERVLLGEKIKRVEVLLKHCFHGRASVLKKGEVESLTRRGKLLQIHMTSGWSILVHLRMTGQLIYVSSTEEREGGGHPDDSLINNLPNKPTRVVLSLSSGATLYFNDQRTFGSLKLWKTDALDEEPFLAKLGPEPWAKAFHKNYLGDILARRKRSTIKGVLLDQEVVAGLGNIYVDEALFLAGVRPSRKAGDVKKRELSKLMKTIVEVLERGIEYGGVSARDYVNAEGLKGKMQEQLYVYRREGQLCKQCESLIEKTKVAGRGTHYCPGCQK